MSDCKDWGFNPDEYEPEQPGGDFSALPEGDYQACLTGCERKEISNGRGWAVNLEFTVQGGEHHGRKVYQYLCVGHATSDIAARIARGQISKLCETLGKPNATPPELYGVPLVLRLKCRSSDGKVYNDVKGYYPASPRQRQPATSGGQAKTTRQQVIEDAQRPDYNALPDAMTDPLSTMDEVPF